MQYALQSRMCIASRMTPDIYFPNDRRSYDNDHAYACPVRIGDDDCIDYCIISIYIYLLPPSYLKCFNFGPP
jgi:hypothetical protein